MHTFDWFVGDYVLIVSLHLFVYLTRNSKIFDTFLTFYIFFISASGPISNVERPNLVDEPSEVLQQWQLESIGMVFLTMFMVIHLDSPYAGGVSV